MPRWSFEKRLFAWMLSSFGVFLFYGTAVWSVVEETRHRVAHDRDYLMAGEVIFPIGHYVVNGLPGPIYLDRLNAVVFLWREQPRPVWLLAGGQSALKESVAAVGKRYLEQQGIPGTFVFTIDDLPQHQSSLDTTEEIGLASNLAKEARFKKIIVIGELMHLAQARLVFNAYGIDALLVDTPGVSYGLRYNVTRLGALGNTLLDRKGISLFWLRWIRGAWPNWPWGEA